MLTRWGKTNTNGKRTHRRQEFQGTRRCRGGDGDATRELMGRRMPFLLKGGARIDALGNDWLGVEGAAVDVF